MQEIDRPIAAVTGATGGIGRILVPELVAQGYDVRALVRRESMGKVPHTEHVTAVEVDLNDIFALAEPLKGSDIVFHLAANTIQGAGRGKVYEDPWKMNGRVSQTFLHAAIMAEVQRFMAASTIAVYGGNQEGVIFEDAKLKGKGAYPESKIWMEQLLKQSSLDDREIRVLIVRLASVFGKDAPWSKFFGDKIKNKEPLVPRPGDGLLSIVDIEDAVKVMILLAQHPDATGVYNVAADKAITVKETADIYEGALGTGAIEVPKFLVKAKGGWEELKSWRTGKPAALTRDIANMLSNPNAVVSNQRVVDLLGYKFKSPQETMKASAKWAASGR